MRSILPDWHQRQREILVHSWSYILHRSRGPVHLWTFPWTHNHRSTPPSGWWGRQIRQWWVELLLSQWDNPRCLLLIQDWGTQIHRESKCCDSAHQILSILEAYKHSHLLICSESYQKKLKCWQSHGEYQIPGFLWAVYILALPTLSWDHIHRNRYGDWVDRESSFHLRRFCNPGVHHIEIGSLCNTGWFLLSGTCSDHWDPSQWNHQLLQMLFLIHSCRGKWPLNLLYMGFRLCSQPTVQMNRQGLVCLQLEPDIPSL